MDFTQFDLLTIQGQEAAEAAVRENVITELNKLSGMPKVIARVSGGYQSAYIEVGVAKSEEQPDHFLFGSTVECRRDCYMMRKNEMRHTMGYGSCGSFDPKNLEEYRDSVEKTKIAMSLLNNWDSVIQLLINIEAMFKALSEEYRRQSGE